MATLRIKVKKDRNGSNPFENSESTAIDLATDDAERMAIRGLNVLNQIWNQRRGSTRRRRRREAWRGNPFVVRWFGSGKLNNEQIRKTRDRMRKIRREFLKPIRITKIQYQSGPKSYLCSGRKVAYCTPGTPIKICPRFFDNIIMNRQERAITIIHELGHKNSLLIHQRGVDRYNHPGASSLAQNHPRLARRNTANFAGYCNEFYTP